MKILALILVFMSTSIHAKGFYEGKGEGWFWYQDPIIEEPMVEEPKKEEKKEEPKKEEPKKEVVKNQFNKEIEIIKEQKEESKEPPPMSTKWLKDNIPKYIAEAQDNPTKENIELVLLLNRVAIDKAQVFAEKAKDISRLDPVLSGRGMFPQSMPERQYEYGSIEKVAEGSMKELSKKTGLYFFFHSDCPYSRQQVGVMEDMKRLYNIDIVAISMNGKGIKGTSFENKFLPDNGKAKKLGIDVKITPSIYLFNAENKKLAFVGAGFTLADDLRDNILTVAKNEKWINDERVKDLRIVKPMFYNDEDKKITEKDVLDKTELSKRIRENIKLR